MRPTLEVNGKRKYKSCWGAFVSTLCILAVIFYSLLKFPLLSVTESLAVDTELAQFAANATYLNETIMDSAATDDEIFVEKLEAYLESDDSVRLLANLLVAKGVIEKPKSGLLWILDMLAHIGGFCVIAHWALGFIAS